MDKKAQSLSLNVIIIAALAIIVFVILAALFVGKIGEFGKKTTKTCAAIGGICAEECQENYVEKKGYACGDEDLVCCVPKEALQLSSASE